MIQISDEFVIPDMSTRIRLAELIEHIPLLSLQDVIVFSETPIRSKDLTH